MGYETTYDAKISKIVGKNINDFYFDTNEVVYDNTHDDMTSVKDFSTSEGGNINKLKSTKKKVKILYNKKEIERTIYINKRGTKYVKINKEYKLLSKLKKI